MPPVRVLHVVGQMNRGGIESWLMQVLRHINRERVQMDFFASKGLPGDYDDEVRAHGSRVYYSSPPSQPHRYARDLIAVLRQDRPYDVVHSHVHFFSGVVLALAQFARVPRRIAHSHTDSSLLDAKAPAHRRAYFAAMRRAIGWHATRGLAASESAAAALFGPGWRKSPRWRVLHCAVDLDVYRRPAPRWEVREELGITEADLVVGHVGRFCAAKNHEFLLRIAAVLAASHARARFVLVGGGELRERVEALACDLGIRDRVVFTGVRQDVPRLLAAFDALLFPSLYEGLPLVGIEAQAAGVPVVLSNTVTTEVTVVPELVHWCSLNDAPELWADQLLTAIRSRATTRSAALAALDRSDFSLTRSLRMLEEEYGVAP